MQNNTPHPTPKYIVAGLGGAAILAIAQKLLPILTALISSITSGGNTFNYVECGSNISGDNNIIGNNIVFCDEVNQFIDETLLLDLDISQTLEWEQIIRNSLDLNLNTDTTFANTSLVYQLSHISQLIEVSAESSAPCYLPNTGPAFDIYTWELYEEAAKKKFRPVNIKPSTQLREKLGTEHCDNISIPPSGSRWCSIETAVF